jgi:hypothetical protein
LVLPTHQPFARCSASAIENESLEERILEDLEDEEKAEEEQEVDGFFADGKIRRFGRAREEKRDRSASTQNIAMNYHVSRVKAVRA